MKSKVYYIKTNYESPNYDKIIEKIIEKTGFYEKLKTSDNVSIAIHLRDIDDSKYVNSDILTQIEKNIENKDAKYSLIGNDTLFHSKSNNKELKEILEENDLLVKTEHEIIEKIPENELFKSVPVIRDVEESDYMIVLSHFKGHSMIGFSGAIKNVATGLTSKKGQTILHKLVQPFVSKISCLACNVCKKICPEQSISVDSIAHINNKSCTGCNVCVSSCPKDAIKINKISSKQFMKGLTEFSSTILSNKKDNKVLFINTLIKIKPYYDNKLDKNENITEDIGVLASFDPVAVDKASYDLINKSNNEEDTDKFRQLWRTVDGTDIFKYAEELGIGTQNYELNELEVNL